MRSLKIEKMAIFFKYMFVPITYLCCRPVLRWNNAGGKTLKGLTRRRQAERTLLLKLSKE